jgi:hypothetical protein
VNTTPDLQKIKNFEFFSVCSISSEAINTSWTFSWGKSFFSLSSFNCIQIFPHLPPFNAADILFSFLRQQNKLLRLYDIIPKIS